MPHGAALKKKGKKEGNDKDNNVNQSLARLMNRANKRHYEWEGDTITDKVWKITKY